MKESTQQQEWVTSKYLAEKFRVSNNSFLRLAESGKFPKPLKLGRNFRWNLKEINAWIEAQKNS